MRQMDFKLRTFDGYEISASLLGDVEPSGVAALILSGSGVHGVDGNVSSPFVGQPLPGESGALSEQIAEALWNEKGVASLRIAKRGFDQTTSLDQHTLRHHVEDARTAFSYLKEKFQSVFVVGFSEGAWSAMLLAQDEPDVAQLILLSPLTESIDDLLIYQFVDWPLKKLWSFSDEKNQRLYLKDLEKAGVDRLPVLNLPLDSLKWENNQVDFQQLRKLYEEGYEKTREFLKTPPMNGWYNSLREGPSFKEVAQKIKCKVSVSVVEDDSQIRSEAATANCRLGFSCLKGIKSWDEMGHCFSPYIGHFEKTTGPIDPRVLMWIAEEVQG